jgi:phage baseplate assembly protein gpV
MLEHPVYRGTVTYSDSTTGEIKVRVPLLTGINGAVPISYIGRTAYNGVWSVPSIGSQIVVTADDANLTNVFWIQVSPDPATSLDALQSQIDALFLGIFR